MQNTSIRPGTFTGTSVPFTDAPLPVQPRQPALRIHYGRTALALAGALALVVVVIGLPLAAFGAASWWIPGAALAVGAAAIASLRALAVQARRARVDAAFRAAMSAGRPTPRQPDPEIPAPEPVRHYPETVLFDAQSTSGAGRPTATVPAADAAGASVTTAPGAPDRRPTAAELRSAALEVAAKTAPAGPPKTSTTPWEPVAVPKPIYVEAPVASRPAPEPLVLPETPKPAARTPLRAPAESSDSRSVAAPTTGKINLDDVLQRRRA